MAETLHVVLSVAQTLSFALPSPVGPAVAAGIQLLDMLSPQSPGTDPSKQILDRLTEVAQEIKDFLTTQQLDDVAVDLGTIKDFVATATTLAGSDEDEGVLSIHYHDALTRIESSALVLNNFIERDLNKLKKIRGSGDTAYTTSCTAVQLYLNLLMSYICLLKLRCEYANRIVDFATRVDGWAPRKLIDDVFAKIDDFWVKLDYWTTSDQLADFNAWVAKIKSDRLARIGQVQTKGQDDANLITQTVNSFAYECFMDGDTEQGKMQHTCQFINHRYSRGVRVEAKFSDRRAEVQQERDRYYAAQQQQTEIDFSYANDTIKAIRDQAAQLSKPVGTPSAAPKFGTSDTKWEKAWQSAAGTKVLYGIFFANSHQSSEIIWSDVAADAPPPGSICPALTLPVDTGGGTTVRHVYRKLHAPNSTDTGAFLCASIQDNGITELVDLDPDDWSNVSPNALSPAKIESWQRHFKAAGIADADAPSWPTGYRVRYRYSYLAKVGASLGRSPWSLASVGIGDADSEGYCAGGDGGYLAELKVPRDPKGKATGCKVYRQFKGKPETEIAASVEIRGRDFIVRDSSL